MGGGYSIFDSISSDDLIMAFFPCVYFCKPSQLGFNYRNRNYRKLNMKEATDKILQRAQNREYYYSLLIKLFAIAYIKNIRMIVENPATEPHYLLYPCNFIYAPTFIDHNRRLRGDFFPKPTAYWFVGCEPTSGLSAFTPKEKKTILKAKQSLSAGVCSEERSIITPDYARNFICDFIIGKLQKYSQLSITDLTTETLNF